MATTAPLQGPAIDWTGMVRAAGRLLEHQPREPGGGRWYISGRDAGRGEGGGRCREGRVSRVAAHQPHPARGVLRQARPTRQARHRRARRTDGPRVRQGRHRVPGGGHRRAAHDPVRLRHRPACRSATCCRRRSRRRTPSCGASRGASSRSSRRGTSRSPCRCGCSGRSLLEGNTAVFKPSEDTPAIGQRLVELFARSRLPGGRRQPRPRRRAKSGEALVQEPGRQRRPVHRQLRRRQAHSGSVGEHARPHRRRRDGQQERGHRLRRRPLRPGGHGRHRQRLQDERPALRLGGPHPRARNADRPLREGVRRHREAAASSATRSTRRTSPGRSSTARRSRRS